MINRAPQVMTLTVDTYERLIKVPFPLPGALDPTDPLAANFSSKQRAEPVPPQPNRLLANVDPTFEQQVLDVPQFQRKADIHDHN